MPHDADFIRNSITPRSLSILTTTHLTSLDGVLPSASTSVALTIWQTTVIFRSLDSVWFDAHPQTDYLPFLRDRDDDDDENKEEVGL